MFICNNRSTEFHLIKKWELWYWIRLSWWLSVIIIPERLNPESIISDGGPMTICCINTHRQILKISKWQNKESIEIFCITRGLCLARKSQKTPAMFQETGILVWQSTMTSQSSLWFTTHQPLRIICYWHHMNIIGGAKTYVSIQTWECLTIAQRGKENQCKKWIRQSHTAGLRSKIMMLDCCLKLLVQLSAKLKKEKEDH